MNLLDSIKTRVHRGHFSPADALALLQNIERRFPKIRQIAQNQ
jgi:hypothetical protein